MTGFVMGKMQKKKLEKGSSVAWLSQNNDIKKTIKFQYGKALMSPSGQGRNMNDGFYKKNMFIDA